MGNGGAVHRRASPQGRLSKIIDALRRNELVHWLCHSQEGGAPFVLVRGWTGLVRRLALDCIDIAASAAALSRAEGWLLREGSWHCRADGSASWRILLPDGAWAATLMTEGRSLDEAKRALLL
jgi:hypothetical protein